MNDYKVTVTFKIRTRSVLADKEQQDLQEQSLAEAVARNVTREAYSTTFDMEVGGSTAEVIEADAGQVTLA